MLSKWIRTVYICFLLNHHSRSCIFFAAASARGADVSNFQVNTKLCQCTERLRGPCHIRLWRKYRFCTFSFGIGPATAVLSASGVSDSWWCASLPSSQQNLFLQLPESSTTLISVGCGNFPDLQHGGLFVCLFLFFKDPR